LRGGWRGTELLQPLGGKRADLGIRILEGIVEIDATTFPSSGSDRS
jgi:hypothetical protein